MKINNSIQLGKALRNKRKAFGYTQQYVSDVTGLSVSFISDLERGKETTEIGKTILLINMLGLNFNLEER